MAKFFMRKGIDRAWAEWVGKAEDDFEVIGAILNENAPPSAACFHAQQAAEKLLKALAIYRKKQLKKSHDLTVLAKLIADTDPEVIEYKQELVLLNRFYIRTRYPAHTPEFSRQDADLALAAAKRVREFVVGKIE